MKPFWTILFVLLIVNVRAFEEGNFELGRVCIKLKAEYHNSLSRSGIGTGIGSLDQRLRELGCNEIKPRFLPQKRTQAAQNLELLYELSFDPRLSVLGMINSLQDNPYIEYSEPIYIHSVEAVPDDPRYAECLNLPAVSAEAAWDIHKCGDNPNRTIIAIIDTGVRWDNPDLAENIWQNLAEDSNANGYTMYHNGISWIMDTGDLNGIDDDGNGFTDDLIGWDFMLDAAGNQSNNPTDPASHGTRVAGLAGARTNNATGTSSLSWNPILLPISCTHAGAASSIYRGYEAIVYAADNGADIINCSWGSTSWSQAGQDVIDYAYSLGAIIVAAAGNSNSSVPVYPSAYSKVIATAALNNDGTRWTGSNYGGYIDLGAPAQSVLTTQGTGYATINPATSYATPVASALFALVRSFNPAWTQEQVINQVKGTCDDIDHLNPGKENLLGEGKINAFRALTELNPSPDQELHLGLVGSVQPNDTNGNRAVEPGESFSLSFLLRNYAWNVSSSSATFVLSSGNPMVQIQSNTVLASIPADDYISFSEAFLVSVNPLAGSQYVSFTLTTTADYPVITGASLTFQILIHNGGIFVWEPSYNARNMSGNFIRNTLQGLGYPVVYGNSFPASLHSFDPVFLCFGTPGTTIFRFSEPVMCTALQEHLEGGGRLYMEGGDVIGWDMAYYLPDLGGGQGADDILWPLLGVSYAEDGTTNQINALEGQSPLPTAGMLFTASSQTSNTTIDKIYPLRGQAATAFTESDYGSVAVISAGGYEQRSFVISYALAELTDAGFPSTRANLVEQIMEFFESEHVTLPVTLSSFTAVWNNVVTLNWSTASETQLLGFNLFRSNIPSLDTASKLNPVLIQATGIGSQGSNYSFIDWSEYNQEVVFYWLEAISIDGNSQFFGSIRIQIEIQDPNPPEPPAHFTHLGIVFPNPFDNQISCNFSLASKSAVTFRVYNVRGQVMMESETQEYEPGSHNRIFSLRDTGFESSGIYILEMKMGDRLFRRRLVKL